MAITSTQAAIQEDLVSEIITEVLIAEAVMPGAVSDFTSLVGPGMDRVSIPRPDSLSVTMKAPGTPVTDATAAFNQDELLLDRHGVVPFNIERRAELQSKLSIANEYISQAGRLVAAQTDADLIAAVNGGSAQSLATLGTLAKADILDARSRMNVANVPMDDRFAVIHPDEEADLLGTAEWTQANTAGTDRALRNGEIGRLYGFTFLMSSQQTAGTVTFFHRSACAYARQKQVGVDQEKDLLNVADRWVIDALWGTKLLDASSSRALVYS